MVQNSHRVINLSDGFESSTLAAIWSSEKLIPGALEIQSVVVRSDKGAARLALKQGDQICKEKGIILERAELLESKRLWTLEDSAYSYAFSLFLPSDFPVVPTRLVIAQWKQDCEAGDCDPASPVVAFRFQSGALTVNVQFDTSQKVLFRTTEDVRNKWLYFAFCIRFSRTGRGRIKASLNHDPIIDYAGRTAYSENNGYPMPSHFYFKMGLYRDTMAEPMVIYIDDYRKQYHLIDDPEGRNIENI
jgi:hypothetical protein